jgi:hydroxymethylpyrimidine pyrophosphatase-like HAD family hydrolase
MQVIYKARQNGKTIEAIKIAAETGSYLVCANKRECERVARVAQELGLNIPFPISFGEFMNKEYHAEGIKGCVIDNADLLLQYFLTPVPIKAITLTNNNE